MKPIVMAMPGNEHLSGELATRLDLDQAEVTVRRFPDGESHVRIETPVEGRQAVIVCTLDWPDDKLVPLFLLACAVREAGAVSVGLVAPYLAYMRQDNRFQPGETISAQHVAAWISHHGLGVAAHGQTAEATLPVRAHYHQVAAMFDRFGVDDFRDARLRHFANEGLAHHTGIRGRLLGLVQCALPTLPQCVAHGLVIHDG